MQASPPAGTARQAAHHPSGNDLEEKAIKQRIFVIIYVSFQSRAIIRRKVREEILGTLVILREALCTSDHPLHVRLSILNPV